MDSVNIGPGNGLVASDNKLVPILWIDATLYEKYFINILSQVASPIHEMCWSRRLNCHRNIHMIKFQSVRFFYSKSQSQAVQSMNLAKALSVVSLI